MCLCLLGFAGAVPGHCQGRDGGAGGGRDVLGREEGSALLLAHFVYQVSPGVTRKDHCSNNQPPSPLGSCLLWQERVKQRR